jgi:DNA gyrase subunit A
MNLRGGDRLVSMDVLPAELADRVAAGGDSGDASDEAEDEGLELAGAEGPWVLVASASGLGKRVPVNQFRLQKRAGMGLRAIKFRRDGDVLVGLKVLGAGEELLLVSERGVIVRMRADAVPQQSRAATGVRLQRLDSGDRLAEVVLVPPALEGEDGEPVAEPDLLEAVGQSAGQSPADPTGDATVPAAAGPSPADAAEAGPADSLADAGDDPVDAAEAGEAGTPD